MIESTSVWMQETGPSTRWRGQAVARRVTTDASVAESIIGAQGTVLPIHLLRKPSYIQEVCWISIPEMKLEEVVIRYTGKDISGYH